MRLLCALLALSSSLFAHPMGNFSVSHYARIEAAPGQSKLVYVLDFAEIPSFELLKQWGISSRDATPAQIRDRVVAEAPRWLAGLSLRQDGQVVPIEMRSVSVKLNDGAGGLAVFRVRIEATAALQAGRIDYADGNFTGKPGWKEIVLSGGNAGAFSQDRSAELTSYPSERSKDAPQQVAASFQWNGAASAEHQWNGAAPAASAVSRPKSQPVGSVKSDFLTQLLSRRSLGWEMILAGLIAAFGLGAMHALSPGHGKAIVAAYLVGSRGDARHAVFLGAMVTFTHTVSVFALGLGVMFFERFVQPERIIPILGAVSGLSIVIVGVWLLYRRFRVLVEDGLGVPKHSHHHPHGHHAHGHDHGHSHDHGFTHAHDGFEHSHFLPDGEVSLASLIVLGISGGLVPCPSALILTLSAIGIGRTAFGIGLLVAFSAGLALVLTAIGLVVLFAKVRLPQRIALRDSLAMRLAPVASALAVTVLGGLMTLHSMGWIKPFDFLS